MSVLDDLFDKSVHQDQPQRAISIPMSSYTEAGMKAAFAAALADREPELVDVPVRMLRATQAMVNIRDGASDEPISVIRDAQGFVHIADGHHRAEEAKRSGRTTISAAVFDLDLTKAVSDRFTFDRFDEATQRWLRYQQDELIKELEADVRDVIEMVVQRGVRAGWDVDQISEQIREVISLTDRQAQAVMNYRSMLEDLDSDALSRQLRSGAFDEALREAIDNDVPLDEAMIDEMVGAYEENYLDYRADTIAQTESTRMANAGLQDSYEQAIERGALPADAVRQFWQLDLDERTCDICAPIPDLNPDGVPMGEDFDSDEGGIDGPPVHPNCRCSIEIVTDLDAVPDAEAE